MPPSHAIHIMWVPPLASLPLLCLPNVDARVPRVHCPLSLGGIDVTSWRLEIMASNIFFLLSGEVRRRCGMDGILSLSKTASNSHYWLLVQSSLRVVMTIEFV